MAPSAYRGPFDLLDDLGITEPDEIIIEALAAHCGATILDEPLAGCEARLIGYGDRAVITVNSASSVERRRFSAAHELGHWVRDRGRVAVACSEEMLAGKWQDKSRESGANRFAADLLLPDPIFRPRAKNRPITLSTVRGLGTAFRTSVTATAIRLVELGSLPGMVICSGPKGRLWFVKGPDVPMALFPLRAPGKGSVAYDLLQGKMDAGDADVEADNWIDHPEAGRYEIHEDSMHITKDLVLTLLWWKDEAQIIDLDGDE
jgi:hypothetical protein